VAADALDWITTASITFRQRPPFGILNRRESNNSFFGRELSGGKVNSGRKRLAATPTLREKR